MKDASWSFHETSDAGVVGLLLVLLMCLIVDRETKVPTVLSIADLVISLWAGYYLWKLGGRQITKLAASAAQNDDE